MAFVHVLIVASEEFVPASNPTSAIFERDQALALTDQGARVGVLSIASHFPLWPASKAAVRALLTGHRVAGLRNLSRSVASFARRPSNRLEQHGRVFVSRTTNRRFDFRPTQLEDAHRAQLLRRAFDRYRAKNGEPDLIHVHNAVAGGTFAAQLKKTHSIPFVITEHSTAFARLQLPSDVLTRLANVYASADARIVVSPGLAAVLTALDLGSDWTWIPDMLGPEFANIQVTDPTARDRTLLNVGALEPKKGQLGLVRAFASARKASGSAVRLRIVGEGPERLAIQQTIKALGLADAVTLVGPRSRRDLVTELHEARGLVISSEVETFGVVAIEALAVGRPVIATRSGGPEFFLDETCGCLVEPQDVDALAEAMRRLLCEEIHYDPQTLRGIALSRFGADVVSQELLALYDRILRRRQNGAANR